MEKNMDREELISKLQSAAPEMQKIMESFNEGPPNWEPLEKVLPMKHCDGFMYMGCDRGIHMYKHGFTRHYMLLDDQANAYRYVETTERYVPIHSDAAIERVFEGLEKMGLTRETIWDHEAFLLRQQALADAGWTVINVGPGHEDDFPST
ncbi:MAG TPA: hypothetical protein VEV82_10485 [Actinomycetota bacterium]|nr:hypothetical protein [Actinomycetota bacterium]